MEQRQALTALQALANKDRLTLVRLLMPLAPEGLAAGEIARALGLSASRLSFHLAQLEHAGLVRARKVARNVIYSVDAGGMGGTISFLMNDCCHDHPEVLACCRHRSEQKAAAAGAPPPLADSPLAGPPVTAPPEA